MVRVGLSGRGLDIHDAIMQVLYPLLFTGFFFNNAEIKGNWLLQFSQLVHPTCYFHYKYKILKQEHSSISSSTSLVTLVCIFSNLIFLTMHFNKHTTLVGPLMMLYQHSSAKKKFMNTHNVVFTSFLTMNTRTTIVVTDGTFSTELS